MTHDALNPAGVQAQSISNLWWTMIGIETAIFVLVMLFLAAAVFRRRRLAIVSRTVPRDAAQEERMAVTVGAAVVLTIAILFVFLFHSFLTGRAVSGLSTPNPLTIEVIGHQWWWEIQYTFSDPSKIVRTANEIHIPAGEPVLLKLFSRDVIHSFWVPALHGKRDLIPGQENEIWIQAAEAGKYEGQCAEFCGHQHAHMRLFVISHEPEEFASWLEAQRAPAVAPINEEQVHGQQVFLSGPCILCHAIQGTPAAATNGPNLTHIASRLTLAAGAIPNTRGDLGGWISDSQSIKPGNRMPPVNLDSQDLQALLAYLEILK